MMNVALVDTGLGNICSVERALRTAAKLDVRVTSDADAIRRADALVVPGQGAFRDCTRALERGLGDAIRDKIRSGAPYLGICLGLQILFGSSDEAPGCAGLGVFSGHVRRIDPGEGEKVPHTGWNTVESQHPLLAKTAWFYFVHSFVAAPDDPSIVAGTTAHGRDRFASVIAKDNVLAVQFHPEKSQRAGLELLSRFFHA
jgi:glutamine amidotransferase